MEVREIMNQHYCLTDQGHLKFLSRYLHKPGVKHMQAAKHTLGYLKDTKDLGIRFTRDQDHQSARDQG